MYCPPVACKQMVIVWDFGVANFKVKTSLHIITNNVAVKDFFKFSVLLSGHSVGIHSQT